MVFHICQLCDFKSTLLSNYNRHLKTQKHLKNEEKMRKNEENEEKRISDNTNLNQQTILFSEKLPHFICKFCSKKFSRNDNLQRHISVCKLNISVTSIHKYPQVSKKEEKKNNFVCKFCFNQYKSHRGLSKHVRNCVIGEQKMTQQNLKMNELEKTFETRLLQKDLENKNKIIEEQRKTIETVKKMKPTVTHITNNNSTNKTINYLNTQYGEMIAMEKFLHNLQYEEQLTTEECRKLLTSYKDSGIELFARSFSHVMKENCRRQLLKQGLPEMDIIPLYCSDGNFRSHKEKNSKGWKTKYDNQSLNSMINISSEQVYENCQKPLMIFGKERNKVFKQLKQDNHSQKITDKKLIENN